MRLVEEFNTQYFIEDFSVKLDSFLADKAEVEIDIAGAKFVPDTMSVINRYALSGWNIIDSGSPSRNSRLQQTKSRAELVNIETVPLPLLEDFSELVPYLKSLDRSVVYSFPDSGDKRYDIGLVMLIQYYTPTVKIDISGHQLEVGVFIGNSIKGEDFQNMIKSTNEFLFLNYSQNFIETIEVKDMNEQFDLCGEKVTWDNVLGKYYVVPTYFGNTPIKNDPNKVHMFRRVKGKASDEVIEGIKRKKNKKRTLNEFLKG